MNIILISIDSLRKDRVGCYNPDKKHLTPGLNQLAETGVVFENNYTVSNGSNPSHCSILTGLYPVHHSVHQNGWKLPLDKNTLAQELQKKGYYTIGAVSLETLSSAYNLNQGFDKFYDNSKYDPLMRLAARCGYKRYTLAKFLQEARLFDTHSRDYESTNKEVLNWIEQNFQKKFFLFVHYFDIHRDTYGRKNNRRDKLYKEENYDQNVKISDLAVQQLVEKLKEKGVYEDTLIVILADHGENIFDKYPLVNHGWEISQPEFNTPLIIHFPKAIAAKRIKFLTRTIDVMPTILDLAGGKILENIDGKSLKKPILISKAEDLTPDIADNLPTAVLMENYAGFKNIKGIKKGKWFYILREDKIEELYDTEKDYTLTQNLILENQELALRLNTAIKTYYQDKKPDQETDEYTKEMLRKLGYL